MNRQQFLDDAWCAYPSAKSPEWIDVSAFIENNHALEPHVVVCGRWSPDPRSPRIGKLEFGGASLGISILDRAHWLEPQRNGVSFAAEWLEEGDLIAVKVATGVKTGVTTQGATNRGSDQKHYDLLRLNVEGVLLLAPKLSASPSWRGFDFKASRNWQKFVAQVRAFFEQRDFVEANTPTLVVSPGTEPFLETFSTEWRLGSRRVPLFLPTSPEFHLKKMVARGWPRLFEIKTCFRNEEVGAHHQAEFAMLEWYRAFSNLDAIANDVENLFSVLSEAFGKTKEPLLRTSVRELFRNAFDGFELSSTTSTQELFDLAKASDIAVRSDDTWDEVFFRLFLERIEPELGFRQPILVHGYPASQAALSRIGENGFADRFEIYWRGLEIANAFHELNDPHENEARFIEDAAKRRAMGKVPVPRDEDLLAAMRSGFPPSGGIALGMERLFMALFEIPTIEKTRAFPLVDEG